MKHTMFMIGLLVAVVAVAAYMNQGPLETFLTYVFVPRWRGSGRRWRPHYVTYVSSESFQDSGDRIRYRSSGTIPNVENFADQPAFVASEPEKDDVTTFLPNSPAVANLNVDETYTLLRDDNGITPMPAPGQISCVNSQTCYMTDFSHLLEQGGNFRQFTNNYKRQGPDNCTAPFQEMVASFYKPYDLVVPSAPANCI
uniref:Uncharacterized protein n=1 Tax=viral metagenome TaxID=1070528 RepID=A0A6C0AR41_9ZZZZ